MKISEHQQAREVQKMEPLMMTKHELVTFLQNTQFEHLSRNEQARLRDYFENILRTLQDAAEGRQLRRRKRR